MCGGAAVPDFCRGNEVGGEGVGKTGAGDGRGLCGGLCGSAAVVSTENPPSFPVNCFPGLFHTGRGGRRWGNGDASCHGVRRFPGNFHQ